MSGSKHPQSLSEDIKKITQEHGHMKLLDDDVQNLTQVLGNIFDQCEGAYSTLEVCRTEGLQTMVKVSEKQYKPLHDALMKAKNKLNFGMNVDMYVVSNPSLNAGSFKLPNQTSEIIVNSGLVELLKLLERGNENLALVVLLHELGHLMFRQSDIDTGMRIYSAFLNDGSITKSVLLQQTTNVYRKYSVAMELTADRVMYIVMKDISGGWDAIMTVFGNLAGGVKGFPINCEELLKQYNDGDVGVGNCLYTGVTSKDAHPPILFRLQELSDLHSGKVYNAHIVGLQEFSCAAATKANTLWDSY
jgi:Zn-dependent protease with chaperone function